MGKDDVVDLPVGPPRKRRALERAPDIWLARWLADESLVPADRRRVEQEKARRKTVTPDRVVGVVVGAEGVTPEQATAIQRALSASGATEIHHPWLPGRVHGMCRALGVPVRIADTPREAVRTADLVIAAPKESREPTTASVSVVWELIRYARHRRTTVKIAMPDGTLN